jgi:hypothetical protein
MKINEVEVKVIATGIEKYGRTWDEIEFFPSVQVYFPNGRVEQEDWLVLSDDDKDLYMNNLYGYMVLIEKQKEHYEEGKGYVLDKKGHIYFTYF